MSKKAWYVVAGAAIAVIVLLVIGSLFGESIIDQFSPPQLQIEEPQQLAARQEHAEVRGQLECSCDTNDLDVLVYVKYNPGNIWYRSERPEQAMRRWSIPANYITFPVTHSNFTLVAIVASSDQTRYTPRDLQANDITDFRKKMLEGGYIYKNDSNYISPELLLSRTRIAIAPTPTSTATSTPSPTKAPSPTFTNTPTATPTPFTSIDTPRPRATSTPIYPKPVLEPVSIIGCNVTFKWNWVGRLAEDEWFAPRVGIGRPHSIVWTKEREYIAVLEAPGDYSWQIAICRGNPAEMACEEIAVSEMGFFSFRGCAATPPPP